MPPHFHFQSTESDLSCVACHITHGDTQAHLREMPVQIASAQAATATLHVRLCDHHWEIAKEVKPVGLQYSTCVTSLLRRLLRGSK